MEAKSTASVFLVVLVGQLWVNLPVLIIIAMVSATISKWIGPADERHMSLGLLMFHEVRIEVGVILGAMLGWLWWSATVPRWREWSIHQGAKLDRVQHWAERTLLEWPKGSAS